jgi:hypothetical protein
MKRGIRTYIPWILTVLGFLGCTLLPTAAFADQRLNVVLTAPIPISTSTSAGTAVGLSYDVYRTPLSKSVSFNVAPFASIGNLGGGYHTLSTAVGAYCGIEYARIIIGAGYALRLGSPTSFHVANKATPVVVFGYRL